MSFQEHTIKTEYRSLIDNVVQKFYVPLLKEAVSYKRAVGFFSSSSLIEISKGIRSVPRRQYRLHCAYRRHHSLFRHRVLLRQP